MAEEKGEEKQEEAAELEQVEAPAEIKKVEEAGAVAASAEGENVEGGGQGAEEAGGEQEATAAPEEPTPREEPAPPAVSTVKKNEPDLSTVDRVAQNKRFYNTHAQQYVRDYPLAPTLASHRDAFLAHIRKQQPPSPATATTTTEEPITMLDLGCGHGLNALHFSSLSHHVESS